MRRDRGSQVAAYLSGVALVGVPRRDCCVELGHGSPQSGEVGDLLVQAGQLLGQLAGRLGTGSLPRVTDLENVTDLGQGSPASLPRRMNPSFPRISSG